VIISTASLIIAILMLPELSRTFFLLNNKSNFTARGSLDADDLYWSSSPPLSTDQRNGNDNKMLTYENSTYGIRMQYPSNWHKEENLSSGSDNNSMLVDVVKFSSPTKNASDTFSESLDLKIDNISDIQPITLAKYADNSIEDLTKDFDVIKLDRNASLSDNPAYKLVYNGVEEGVNLQAMLILTIKEDKAYIISYNAEPPKFSYYLPTLQKMINSFQITK
jgi:eukaryotic-like serine/threonine-protein kinase